MHEINTRKNYYSYGTSFILQIPGLINIVDHSQSFEFVSRVKNYLYTARTTSKTQMLLF